MILEILAHSRQIERQSDVMTIEFPLRADTRQFQKLWRVDSAGAKDHLAPRVGDGLRALLQIFDTYGSPTGKQHPCDHAARLDGDVVSPPARRVKIGARRARSHSPASRPLHTEEAFLAVTIDIVGERVPGLDPGGQKGLEQRVIAIGYRYVDRAVAAAELAGAERARLQFLEIGQAMRK